MGPKRVFKFRVWETVSSSFYYDINSLQRNPSVIFSELFEGKDPLLILQQWSGLKDKNGKDIYEGDILDNGEVVTFTEGCFMTSIGALAFSDTHREVVGNIFENVELVK